MTLFFTPDAPRRPCPASAKIAALILIAGASLGFAGSAAAQQFKVTAAGKITSVNGGIFNSSVVVGTPFTYSFLFNFSIPNGSLDPSPCPSAK